MNITGAEDIIAEFGAYGLDLKTSNQEGGFPFYILFILMAMLSMVALFLFKNRKKQILLTRLNLLLQFCVAAGFLVFSFFGKTGLKDKIVALGYQIEDIEFSFGLGYFFLFLGIPFLLLAIRGIKRDEELLKSIDRIR